MVNIVSIASELGYISLPDNILIDVDQLKNYPDEKTVIITTGSQGESMAALSRMASGMHRKVTIKPNDTIVFSSHPIPGNEKSVTGVINELMRKGADVIFEDVHVSGHACKEDIKLIYSLVNPLYAIPVHGEYKHLIAQAKIAEELGYDSDHIKILSSGDVLEIDENGAEVTGTCAGWQCNGRRTWCRRCRKYRSSGSSASGRRRNYYCRHDTRKRIRTGTCRTGYRIERFRLCT